MSYYLTSFNLDNSDLDSNSICWILGLKYDLLNNKENVSKVKKDIESKIWFSYRKDFIAISPTNKYTSDAGYFFYFLF